MRRWVSVRCLHRAGYVDQQQDAALPQAALQTAQRHYIAVMAHRLAQRAPRVEIIPAPRPHAAIAGPAWQPGGRRTGEAAQQFGVALRPEAPHRQRLGAGRLLSGFVHFVREQRLGTAAAVLLHAHGFVVRLAGCFAFLQFAEKMSIEQRVEGGAALGRRRERRMLGAADVGDRFRTEQADCFEKGRSSVPARPRSR
jgi:hypothetical protein